MKRPIATINDPLAPRATGGKPQPTSRDTRKVKVKAHTRRVKVRVTGGGDLGYLSNDPAALRKYQQFHGLPVTGRWDPKTQQFAHTHSTRLISSQRADEMRAQSQAQAPPPADPFASQVNAAADVKYGPQIRSLNQQVLGSQYNQIRTGNWYSDYEKQLQSQAAAQNQAAANVAAALTKTFGNPAAAQTGNPQADALAAQAAQSQSHLGQAFAGTQSQMALDTANRFATGLIPAAGLAGQATQQNEVNRQQQLQGQLGDVRGQAGEYKTLLRQQIAAAQQKADTDRQKIALAAQALGLKVDTYKNVQVPLARSLERDRTSGQKVARAKARQTGKQNAVKNAIDVNKLALDAQKERDRLLGKGKGSNEGNGIYTRDKLNKYDNQWRGALALAGHLKAAKTYSPKSGPDKGKTLPVTRDVVYSALLKQYPNDPEFAGAAANIIFGQNVEAHDRHVLSTKGVHPGGAVPTGSDVLRGVVRLLSKKRK